MVSGVHHDGHGRILIASAIPPSNEAANLVRVSVNLFGRKLHGTQKRKRKDKQKKKKMGRTPYLTRLSFPFFSCSVLMTRHFWLTTPLAIDHCIPPPLFFSFCHRFLSSCDITWVVTAPNKKRKKGGLKKRSFIQKTWKGGNKREGAT